MSNVFREGRVHVCADKCPTCIFRPGNQMSLQPGRVAGMVRDCLADPDGAGNIPCHEHLNSGADAICRGFWDAHRGGLLQVAERIGIVEYVS